MTSGGGLDEGSDDAARSAAACSVANIAKGVGNSIGSIGLGSFTYNRSNVSAVAVAAARFIMDDGDADKLLGLLAGVAAPDAVNDDDKSPSTGLETIVGAIRREPPIGDAQCVTCA